MKVNDIDYSTFYTRHVTDKNPDQDYKHCFISLTFGWV